MAVAVAVGGKLELWLWLWPWPWLWLWVGPRLRLGVRTGAELTLELATRLTPGRESGLNQSRDLAGRRERGLAVGPGLCVCLGFCAWSWGRSGLGSGLRMKSEPGLELEYIAHTCTGVGAEGRTTE